jgi:hypothetical protein
MTFEARNVYLYFFKEIRPWQNQNQRFSVNRADMNPQNGWESVLPVAHGIRSLKKLL